MSLRQIRAVVAIQLRTFLNTLHQSPAGRGHVTSLAVSTCWYGFWLLVAAALAVVPPLVGRREFEAVLPALLLSVMGYWQLGPLVTLSLGVSLDLRRVLVYPVSPATLFAIECLLRLWTSFEMLLVLLGLSIGLVRMGSASPAGLAAALVLFVAFNMFLSAGLRNLVERYFQKKLVRRLAVVMLVAVALTPQLLLWYEPAWRVASSLLAWVGRIPSTALPSNLAASLMLGQGKTADIVWFLALLAATGLFAYRQFRAVLRRGAVGATPPQSRRPTSMIERVSSLGSYLLPDPLGTLFEKEVKYLWRSPRFRVSFFLGFSFGVLVGYYFLKQWENAIGGGLTEHTVSLVSLYALLLLGPVLFLNRFGFDRHATRMYFWLPLRFSDLILAKNLATGLYAVIQVLAIALVCRLTGLPAGGARIIEALAVCIVALVYLLAVGNHMSVKYPIASNPDRISRAGSGHGIRAAVQFLLFPLSLGPVLAALLVPSFSGAGPGISWPLLTVAAVCGAGLYGWTLIRVARRAVQSREVLVAQLIPGESPIAAE